MGFWCFDLRKKFICINLSNLCQLEINTNIFFVLFIDLLLCVASTQSRDMLINSIKLKENKFTQSKIDLFNQFLFFQCAKK